MHGINQAIIRKLCAPAFEKRFNNGEKLLLREDQQPFAEQTLRNAPAFFLNKPLKAHAFYKLYGNADGYKCCNGKHRRHNGVVDERSEPEIAGRKRNDAQREKIHRARNEASAMVKPALVIPQEERLGFLRFHGSTSLFFMQLCAAGKPAI